MSTSSRVGVDEMEQENQQGTKRTYAQAIRRTTKTKLPQEITEPTQPQETRRATPPEQAPNEDGPFLIQTRDALWTTTEDLHQSRLLKSSSAVLHFPRYSNIDAVDLINALDEIGLCSRYVKAMQCCPQPDVFNVTFHTPRIRKYFLYIGRFTVNDIPALLNDSESPISFIVVKIASSELPDAAIISRLKCFDVLSFCRCKHYGTGIENAPALHVCTFALPFCRMFVLHLKRCMCTILDNPEPADAVTALDMKYTNVITSPALIVMNLATMPLPVPILCAVQSANLPATKLTTVLSH